MTLQIRLKEMSFTAIIITKSCRKVMPAPAICWIIMKKQKTPAARDTARAARCRSESRIRARKRSRPSFRFVAMLRMVSI